MPRVLFGCNKRILRTGQVQQSLIKYFHLQIVKYRCKNTHIAFRAVCVFFYKYAKLSYVPKPVFKYLSVKKTLIMHF